MTSLKLGLLATLSVTVLISVNALGSNGPLFLGLSPVSQAMGGTTVGNNARGVDAMYRNAGMLSEYKGANGSFYGELDFSLLKTNTMGNGTVSGSTSGFVSGLQSARFFPNLGVVYRLNDMLVFGLGFAVIGGAANDHAGAAQLSQLQTDNRIMRIMPTIAVKPIPEFSVGVTPFLNYAELAINDSAPGGAQTARERHGSSGLGVHVGAVTTALKPVTIGIAFSSKTSHLHKAIINLDGYGPSALTGANTDLDDLAVEYPNEYALGIGVDASERLKLTFDWRYIAWDGAEGFRSLGWEKQHVIAMGAQYTWDKWVFRGGFNYAKSPINDQAGEEGARVVTVSGKSVYQRSITTLNLGAFPAVCEYHFTYGAGYQVTEALGLDFAFSFAPKVTVTRSGSQDLSPAIPTPIPYTIVGSNSVWVAQLGAKYQF